MNDGSRTFVTGVAGGVVAFGVAELAHGLFGLVPSVLVAVAQRIIELTPGGLATRAVELLGKADIPVLISVVVILTLVFSGLLANLSRRSPAVALVGVVILGAVALAAAFAEPFVAPVATVLAVLGALGAGVFVASSLMDAAGLRASKSAPADEHPPEPDDGPQPRGTRSREAGSGGVAVGRRNFLVLGGAAAVAGVAAAGAGRALAGRGAIDATDLASVPKKLSPASASSHKTLPKPPAAASIEVPGMPKLVTPNDDFYLIDTAIYSPRVDADRWSLAVKGAVDNPAEISYKDLLGMPTREADITLSCVSNEVGGGLVSHGRWTGVLLSDVLAEAGVRRGPEAAQLVGRSLDGFTTGFRTGIALDGREALVAFGLNGEELPAKHGYPARLVVPGLYGYVSATKWLSEIELTDWGFDAYWIQRGWSKVAPVKTQSRIDTIRNGERVPAGTVKIGGVAWAPHRGIERVEVSTDGGETWNRARLAAQLDADAWRQYLYEWDASSASGDHTVMVRATDGEGETQTGEEAPPHPSGATGYHTVGITVA